MVRLTHKKEIIIKLVKKNRNFFLSLIINEIKVIIKDELFAIILVSQLLSLKKKKKDRKCLHSSQRNIRNLMKVL